MQSPPLKGLFPDGGTKREKLPTSRLWLTDCVRSTGIFWDALVENDRWSVYIYRLSAVGAIGLALPLGMYLATDQLLNGNSAGQGSHGAATKR